MTQHSISAQKRDIFGKKLAQLRRDNKVPGNLYGAQTESIALVFDKKELIKLVSEVSESTLVDLTIDSEKKPRPVLVRNIQNNSVSNALVHIDVQQVNLKEKIQVAITIELEGESPIVADGTGMIETHATEIQVEALPTDLPESITIDATQLTELGQHITAQDLKLPQGVELISEPETLLVSIVEPGQPEEVEADTVTEEKDAIENIEAVAEGEKTESEETEK